VTLLEGGPAKIRETPFMGTRRSKVEKKVTSGETGESAKWLLEGNDKGQGMMEQLLLFGYLEGGRILPKKSEACSKRVGQGKRALDIT